MYKSMGMIFLAALVLFGCNGEWDEPVSPGDGKVWVRIGIQGEEAPVRTVMPQVSLGEVFKYKLEWTGAGTGTETFVNDENKQVGVNPGTYTFTLSAYKSQADMESGTVYLEGKLANKAISASGDTLTFTLTPPASTKTSGTGEIRITLDISRAFPAIVSADVWIAQQGYAGAFDTTLTPEDNSISYAKIEHPAEDYQVKFILKDEQKRTLAVVSETVQVRGGFTSAKTIALSTLDLTTPRTDNPSGTWTPVPGFNLVYAERIASLVWKNDRFMAGNYKGNIWYSSDGVTWTQVQDSPFFSDTAAVNAIDYGEGVWVAVGTKGKIARSEDNGVTWTAATTNPFSASNAISSVAFGNNNRWVAIGASVILAESLDKGKTWTQVPADDRKFTTAPAKIFYGNGKWIATGNTSGGYYSADGHTWNQGTTNSRYALAYAGDKFWASSGTDATNRVLVTSTDGVTWEDASFDLNVFNNPPRNYNGLVIAHGATGWVMGFNHTTVNIAYSPDLQTWTRPYETGIRSGEGFSLIAYGNKTWVIAGNEGSLVYFKEP